MDRSVVLSESRCVGLSGSAPGSAAPRATLHPITRRAVQADSPLWGRALTTFSTPAGRASRLAASDASC